MPKHLQAGGDLEPAHDCVIGSNYQPLRSGFGAMGPLFQGEPVIWLGIGLPDLDGYEVACRIRTMRGLANVLVVALSGYGVPDHERAREPQSTTTL